ncbi:hypothetical protein [Kushneria phosphatilytica]|nr:hypothetical protein [Kushneria phosphatilytica]
MTDEKSDTTRDRSHDHPPEGHSLVGKIAVGVAFLGILAFFVFAFLVG